MYYFCEINFLLDTLSLCVLFRMQPFETSVAIDPNSSYSVLNVTTSSKKAGQSDGIPIPLGLQPPNVQNLVSTKYLISIFI